MRTLYILIFLFSFNNIFAQEEGLEKAFEIIKSIENRDYNRIKDYFFDPISEKLPEEQFKLYVNKAADLIEQYGLPSKDKVLNQLIFSKINEPEITDEQNIRIIYFGFPMPPSDRKEPPLRLINIGFISGKGFDKIVSLQVLDNTQIPKINPDFEAIKKIEINLNQYKRFRIYYEPGKSKNETLSINKTFSEAKNTNGRIVDKIEKIVHQLNESKINQTDTVYDITRYNGNPETISLHLQPSEEIFISPDAMSEPFLMITAIILEENGIKEKETDWIVIRHFKKVNTCYLYYLSKEENMELYNLLVGLKKEKL